MSWDRVSSSSLGLALAADLMAKLARPGLEKKQREPAIDKYRLRKAPVSPPVVP